MGFADPNHSSAKKGETLSDSMRVIGDYADAIVLRHPLEGAAQVAAQVSNARVINAGDGSNEHPTQTLLDLYALKMSQGRLDDLHIALVGDLKHGRTVHSLAKACALFNVRLYFVSPESLSMPSYITDYLREKGIKFSYHRDIQKIVSKVDVLYVTRLQKERLSGAESFDHAWQVTPQLLQDAQPHLKVLHPLPRVDEITPEVDDTPFAYYFQQSRGGVFVRQALLGLIFNEHIE